ncbi:MAG: globin [Myxococcales bacterium]|nr:globin [Myxococcales bacterium]
MIATFEASLARCLRHDGFLQTFYDKFLQSSPEVPRKFAGTDFDRQRKVLESSLYMVARAALGEEDGVEHLQHIAESHSRRRFDIGPSLYALWLDSLVATAREIDPEFDDHVEKCWRALLSANIDYMIDVYRRSRTTPPPRHPRT